MSATGNTRNAGPRTPPRFKLIRYFSLTSLAGLLVVLAVLVAFHGQIDPVVLVSLSLLYLFLFAAVHRADRILSRQDEEVAAAHEQMLRHQALHDSLTGLRNREGFTAHLGVMIKGAKRAGRKWALLCLGLDGIRNVNDSLGHETGDRVLREAGARLKACLRDADVTARIGGDEFAVALAGDSDEWGIEHVVTAVERMQSAVSSRPVAIDGHELAIPTSIGIAIYPDDGTEVAEMFRSANAALHHAKRMGRNNYQFHRTEMNDQALASLVMEGELRRALDEGQFELHFQPKVDLKTKQVMGAEALIRWRHPQRGLVLPGEFIHVAEERGLLVAMGQWVLQEVCRQNKEWQQAGLPGFAVAINLSALQFRQPNLLHAVSRALDESGLAAEFLEIELTESSVMADPEATIATMRRLKDVGVKLSLDDFGTGYSSLSQLKRLPLDKLKIDKAFVHGLPDDADDLAISNAIVGMGKAMGLAVIAEGVETSAQFQVLQSLGCDEMQGYFVARPQGAAGFAHYMGAGSAQRH